TALAGRCRFTCLVCLAVQASRLRLALWGVRVGAVLRVNVGRLEGPHVLLRLLVLLHRDLSALVVGGVLYLLQRSVRVLPKDREFVRELLVLLVRGGRLLCGAGRSRRALAGY